MAPAAEADLSRRFGRRPADTVSPIRRARRRCQRRCEDRPRTQAYAEALAKEPSVVRGPNPPGALRARGRQPCAGDVGRVPGTGLGLAMPAAPERPMRIVQLPQRSVCPTNRRLNVPTSGPATSHLFGIPYLFVIFRRWAHSEIQKRWILGDGGTTMAGFISSRQPGRTTAV